MQGFGTAAASGERTGFRSTSTRSGTGPALDWRNYPDTLTAITERLQGVVIENRDALALMEYHDRPNTLHYVDPPYVHSTRSTKVRHNATGKSYRYELDDNQHKELAAFLKRLRGMVVLSGYVRMTRDGFTLLCMGFTGKEAMHWKVAYINAFNKMEQAIIEQPEILSHNHLLQFAIKTLDLMRDHTLGEPARPRTEQVVCNYLAVESLNAATPEQIKQALNFLQGQIIGEGVAAKSLPSVAGSSIAKDLLYGLLRSAHDAELLFNSLYDSGVEKLASDVFKEHMANTLAATSRQARELLGYVASRATRAPFKPRSTH
ncbi:Rha family transcriptional regulator [Pseudomonas paraeruginosa]|uniref:Rha family transcriptional regulator n=1 Tax=Pseudomonas paraeruginosa TaxID=2994495 RepID=UPI0039FD6468